MRPIEQWIWLPNAIYPDYQTSEYNLLISRSRGDHRFARVAFTRDYRLERAVKDVKLRFSGDTFFSLFCNGIHIASGPASAGGDFLGSDGSCEYTNQPLTNYYATEVTLSKDELPDLSKGRLDFCAHVRMTPARLFDQSKGRGGFFLTAEVRFEDGTKDILLTDETWEVQRLSAYTAPGQFDNSLPEDAPVLAERIINIWNCETAPILPCTEEKLFDCDGILCAPACMSGRKRESDDSRVGEGQSVGESAEERAGEYLGKSAGDCESAEGITLTIPAQSTITTVIYFDKIYAGYVAAHVEFQGNSEDGDQKLTVNVRCRELEEDGTGEQYIFVKNDSYRGLEMHSAGNLLVTAVNEGKKEAFLHLDYIISYYPVMTSIMTRTSDEGINLVLDVCKHTLKQCRQTIHLDSPRHCEPLACTGDYYIEALMTAFTFGDQSLSAFDVRRTAEMLRNRDGRMFHTTYSLIWVQMLWDVYCFTGEKALLKDCEDALMQLLSRFASYIGDNGIIETPPDYMFIDWLIPDGINMHHPPKALGQTCLNMFYYGALKTAVKIFEALGENSMATKQVEAMNRLHDAVYGQLYDKDREIFFEGLNTPTPEELLYTYMPTNVEKRYYRKHANILAAYFGFFDKAQCQKLIHKIMNDPSLGEVQPYFTHFLLEAIYRNDLRKTYTLPVLEQWKEPVRECSKGLVEGFYKPVESYGFDHSHAWGGTPMYSLPLALSGLEILEPGFRRIRLNPSLLGLDEATVQIPTPFGVLELEMKAGEETRMQIPKEVIVENS